jgi:RHS repeat-associated protein
VSRIAISPLKFVGYTNQKMSFSALGADFADRVIEGVRFTWQSSNPAIVEIDDSGEATFLSPGIASITCSAGAAVAVAPVLVRPGPRPLQTDAQWLADQNSISATGQTGSLAPSPLDSFFTTAYAQSCGQGGDGGDVVYDELHSSPANLVGTPHNRAIEPARMSMVLPEGSNFEMAAPIVGLGGRGLGAGITLFYNSRVWSRRSTNTVTFNAVNGWPYAGFSLSFGRVIYYDPVLNPVTGITTVKYLLVDPDGTRHFLGTAPTTGTNTIETSDGTHIRYVGDASSGQLKYADGTRVSMVFLNNRLLPTQITDSNGNYVEIAYKTFFPWMQAIDYVRDTLGRYIQFNYDSCANLVSITAPGFGGTAQNPVTQTIAQFDYQSRSLGFSFNGLTVENATSGQTLNTLRHVYFPSTETGYLFSYSDYGMIYNASMRRQMSIDTNGVISDGVESAKTEFNYPTAGSTTLTDAPAFTQRTETPGGTTGSSTYTYSTSDDTVAQTRTFTITRPDSTTLLLTRSTNSATPAGGRLVKTEIKNGTDSFGKSEYTYTTDGGGSPQVASATNFDDAGTPTKTDFSYNNQGALTNVREYGHQESGQWQVRRRTQYFYKSDSDTNYFNANLWRLVTEAVVYDAKLNTTDSDDEEIAKTTYAYDNYSAMGGMQGYFNSSSAPGHLSSYSTSYTLRGNMTGTTEYTKLSPATTITRLAKFDLFGNAVKAQVTCCNEARWTFSDTNFWAHPVEIINGDPTSVHLKSTVEYDFNTSLVKNNADPNALQTSYEYDAARRLKKTTYPTGATSETTYDDDSLTISSSLNFVESGVNKSATGSGVYDGWGRVKESVNNHSGQVNTVYDAMSRVSSRTNPFLQGGTQYNSSFGYDALGRMTTATLPDNNTITNTYDGVTVTPRDPVGREMKREVDGLGRVVKVTEEDASGGLTQETLYSYDLLDRLVEINQGGQTRGYKYDALGRVLFERIPEQSATISDGAGGMWTMKYTYTNFHAVQTKTDARGVVTTYGYDVLNRLVTISYNTSADSAVAATPNVTYTYDTTTTTSTTKGLVLSVAVGTFYQESYSYDSVNRVSSVTRTIDSNNYTTSYQYNTASQVTQVTYPSGRVVSMSHDSKGRLSSVGGYVSNITYKESGQVGGWSLGTTPTSITESFTYDPQRLQMTNQKAMRGSTVLLDLSYSYQAGDGESGGGTLAGNSGQLMSVTQTPTSTINSQKRDERYKYDNVGRLVSREGWGGGQRKFEYDRWGNRTKVWNSVSGGQQIQNITLQQTGGIPTNRISSVTNTSGNAVEGLSYQYDSAGNVKHDGRHSYKHDAENRIAIVDEGAPQQASYSYDAMNRRVKKVVQGNTVYYIWEGGQVIAEYGSALDEGGGGVRYELADRLSTRMTVDGGGNVRGTQDHLVYGEESQTKGESEKHRLTSYERDGETGMDYAVNRFHASSVGRFNSVDKVAGNIFNPQRLNRYSYVGNDPVNRTDPGGRDWFDLWMDASNPSQFFSGNEFTDWILNQENREFFGYQYYDLPGNFNLLEQEEARHLSIITTGIDPEFCRNFAAQVPSYDALGTGPETAAAREFLDRNFSFLAPAIYAGWSATQQAIFLNTIAAVADAGVNLSNARFGGFYPSADRAYGINLLGLDESSLGPRLTRVGSSFRSDSSIFRGSVEATPIIENGVTVGFSFDVDLYNPGSIALPLHGLEVLGNELTGGITDPISATQALNSRQVFTGINPVCTE